MKLLRNFFNLFFPNYCLACNNNLLTHENYICTKCLYDIPKTGYCFEKDNPVSTLFWGRVNIEHACSFFFYSKGSKFQKLIHNFKYKGDKEIGFELGRIYGLDLRKSEFYKDVDMVIPVPLHPKKERKRGYNQSLWIAKGLSKSLDIEIGDKILLRAVDTDTQTKKSRIERWENVEDVFKVYNADKIKGKHILLVDDVVTTGSTLEACAAKILKHKDVKVSIATLTVA